MQDNPSRPENPNASSPRARLWIPIVALLAAVIGSRHADAQSAEVESAAEAHAVAIVRALASGDAEATWKAAREHLASSTLEKRPESSWKALFAQLAEELEGTAIRGVSIDDQDIILQGRRRDGHSVSFRFGIGMTAPYRLEGFAIDVGGDPSERNPGDSEPGGGDAPAITPGMDRAAATAALEDFIDRHVAATGFSGTVLLAKDGEPWLEGAHGLAHRGYGIANHVGTRFDVGSINKVFTQVAIAQLVVAGKLDLDDTIAELLPDYPNPEVARRVTVRHLVKHTSGLGDIFGPAFFEAAKTRFRQPEDFFPLFADQPLLFEPGSGQQYSNGGYQVLGAIVAARSGMAYHDYIAEKVWMPAGMTETAFIARDVPTPDVAVGYTPHEDGTLRNNLFRLSVIGSPAGSSFSTTRDLLRFDRAMRGTALLPPAWAFWVLTGTEPDADSGGPAPSLEGLGLGFAGGAPGVNAMYEIEGPWTAIVLANQDPPVAGKLARALLRAVRRLE